MTMSDTAELMQIPGYVKRELSEVYLLMDHIAGCKDKCLEAALATPQGSDIKTSLVELCKVQWPPTGTAPDKADQLAMVLTAKDRLTRAAYPATGLSIAFTYLSTAVEDRLPFETFILRLVGGSKRSSEGKPGIDCDHAEAAPRHGRKAVAGAGALAPEPTAVQGGAETPAAAGKGAAAAKKPGGNRRETTIVQFAIDAFPSLVSKRRSLTNYVRGLVLTLCVLLGLTCYEIWDLSVGQHLLADYGAPALTGASTDGSVSPTAASGRTAGDADAVKRRAMLPQLQAWNCHQRLLDWFMDACSGTPPQADPTYNWELTNILVTVMNYNVLPALLGALASAARSIRGIAGKVEANELVPRDLKLVIPRLFLGAFLGVVIGLFVTPSGMLVPGPSQAAGAGAGMDASGTSAAIALSPAALAILAGLATDQIFAWLDNLISRIFGVGVAAK